MDKMYKKMLQDMQRMLIFIYKVQIRLSLYCQAKSLLFITLKQNLINKTLLLKFANKFVQNISGTKEPLHIQRYVTLIGSTYKLILQSTSNC